jgi:hypothetical protein
MCKRAVCRRNPDHREFTTTVTVGQVWKVDEYGEWLETLDDCADIVSGPDPQNQWDCSQCDGEVDFVDDDEDEVEAEED